MSVVQYKLLAMATYRTVHRLDIETAAYLAGLVDGEGSVMLSGGGGSEKRTLVVSISNTDRSLLEFVRRSVGAGCITAKRTYKENHSPSFAYKITNRQALALLTQIVGHLKTYRARRAQMAIERYVSVTPRNGKYGEELAAVKAQFEREFHAIGPGPRYPPRSK